MYEQCDKDRVIVDRAELAYLLHVDEAMAILHAMGVRQWEGYYPAVEKLEGFREDRDFYKKKTYKYPKERDVGEETESSSG